MNRASEPSAEAITKLATALIRQQRTMTLATTDGQRAWAAPVYYVFHKASFFFFSDPQSRHIIETTKCAKVAAAIHANVEGWQDIQGIQMSGTIRQVPTGITGAQAIHAYIQKYPFTKDFFEQDQAMDLAAFAKRFKVKFYQFDPNLVFYQDNRIRFGFRVEVKLEDF